MESNQGLAGKLVDKLVIAIVPSPPPTAPQMSSDLDNKNNLLENIYGWEEPTSSQ